MHAAAVDVIGAVVTPVRAGIGEFSCRDRKNLLNVAVAQIRVGLQHERDDARDDGGGKRSALHVGRVGAEHATLIVHQDARGRGDVRTGGRNENRRTWIGERRLADAEGGYVAGRVDRAGDDRKAVVARGEVVGVAAGLTVVAAGHDNRRAQPAAPIGRRVLERVPQVGVVVEIGNEIGPRHPTVVGHVVPGHLAQFGQVLAVLIDPVPAQLGVVSHPHRPLAVARGDHHAGDQCGVVAEVGANHILCIGQPAGVDIGLQVRMPVVEDLIGDRVGA